MTQPTSPIISINKIKQYDSSGATQTPLFATFEALQNTFTVPVEAGQVGINVTNGLIYAVGQFVYIPGAGAFEIVALSSVTSIMVRNDGSTGNMPAGTTVAATTPMYVCAPPSAVPDIASYQQSGQATVTTAYSNDVQGAVVSFAIPFEVPPTAVILQIESSTNLAGIAGGVQLYVRNKTATGFEIWYSATGVFALTVNYIAMM